MDSRDIKVVELKGSKSISITKERGARNSTDLTLTVTNDGQTQFNIFNNPNNAKTNLFINNSIYFENTSYTIQNISGNWKLVWQNEFQLQTSDQLIFRINP